MSEPRSGTPRAPRCPQKRLKYLSNYYHHELPIKAIARCLNRSEGTIKTHLLNARLQLQELLTPYLNNSDIHTDMKYLKTGFSEIDEE